MSDFTRRSHIVRCFGKTDDIWVDVEVLDAIAFRDNDGDEVILDIPAEDAIPFVVDDTGDGNSKRTLGGTRRSHMKRVTGSDGKGFLDIEIIDAIAFRDKRGEEWILDMPDDGGLDVFDVSTGSGSKASTRRVHKEKIYSNPDDTSSEFLSIIRCDDIAFRSARGEEVVLEMPSCDDPRAANVGFGRASTFTTPLTYKPSVAPPTNRDPNKYVFFPAGGGPYVGDIEIAQGPLWWIRGINPKGGPWYWFIPFQQPLQWTLLVIPGGPAGGDGLDASKAPIPPSQFIWELLPRVSTVIFADHPPSVQAPAIPTIGFATLDEAVLHGIPGSDWGVVDYHDTRLDTHPCVPGVSGNPDIWQLTGIAAPALIPVPGHPSLPGPISDKLAEQVALAYGAAWQATSNGYNGEMNGAQGALAHELKTTPWGYDYYQYDDTVVSFPTTAFHVPLPGPINSLDSVNKGVFLGGIPAGFWVSEGHINLNQPGYAYTLNTAQLDLARWDVSDPSNPKLKT